LPFFTDLLGSSLSLRSGFAVSLCNGSLCFLGGSESSLCLSLSGSLTLLSQFGSLSLVLLYFLSKQCLSGSQLLLGFLSGNLTVLGIFLSLPSLEFLLGGCLIKCTFLHTTQQVLHQKNAFAGEDVLGSVGRLCAYANPIQSTLKIEVYRCGVGVRVVRSDTFDKFAITWRAAVCYYNVIVSVVFVTMTSQTNLCCHFFLLFLYTSSDTHSCGVNKMFIIGFSRKPGAKVLLFFDMTKLFGEKVKKNSFLPDFSPLLLAIFPPSRLLGPIFARMKCKKTDNMTQYMHSRNVFLVITMLLVVALSACTSEKKRLEAEATARYEHAQTLVEEGRLEAAKCELDTIHSLYRQQVAVRRQAKALQDSITYLEAQRTMTYCDSLLQVLLPQVDPLLKRFRYEKDERYEDHGQYVSRLLQTERNIDRNFLQAYITDDRLTRVKSYYYGSKPCEQKWVEIKGAEESVRASGNCHSFKAEGYHSILTVENSAAINLLQFISAHIDERLRVSTAGATYYLSDNEKAALEETYRLGVLFTDIRRAEEMMALAERTVQRYATRNTPSPVAP